MTIRRELIDELLKDYASPRISWAKADCSKVRDSGNDLTTDHL
jgi:hypothetical protein